MKHILFLFLLISGLQAAAQVDSTRIPQAFSIPQKYALHYFKGSDLNDPDVFTQTNVFLSQMDTVGKDTSMKMIYFPAFPSGSLAHGMRRLASLSEGVATTYNNYMLELFLPKITNPWLFSEMLRIRDENWRVRDQRIKEEYELMLKRKQQQP